MTFLKSDLTKEWNIEDSGTDLITCSLELEHIKDLNFIFSEASKKLEINGHLFISELHPFKQYSGSKAKYGTDNGTQELETYVHHISEYLSAAHNNGFKLIELNEWFDELTENEIPRLISFVFQK